MKVRPERLKDELKKSLNTVYLITGDEPLIVQEAMDHVREACRSAGFEERKVLHVDKQFDWNLLLDEANSLSLFSEKKLIELRLGKSKPGAPGGKAIQAYLDAKPEDQVLLIESAKLDGSSLKAKWATAIDNNGAIVQVWPVALHEMPKWIGGRSRQLGLSLAPDAIELLASQLEGNLLAAHQALIKLQLELTEEVLARTITAEDIESSIENASRYDPFELADSALRGNAAQSIKILRGLRSEGQEPTLILWALSKDIRLIDALKNNENNGQPPQQIMKQYRVFPKRQDMLLQASRRHNNRSALTLLSLCKQADDTIKGVSKQESIWNVLEKIVLSTAQPQAMSSIMLNC